jgi:hypothetical protein
MSTAIDNKIRRRRCIHTSNNSKDKAIPCAETSRLLRRASVNPGGQHQSKQNQRSPYPSQTNVQGKAHDDQPALQSLQSTPGAIDARPRYQRHGCHPQAMAREPTSRLSGNDAGSLARCAGSGDISEVAPHCKRASAARLNTPLTRHRAEPDSRRRARCAYGPGGKTMRVRRTLSPASWSFPSRERDRHPPEMGVRPAFFKLVAQGLSRLLTSVAA